MAFGSLSMRPRTRSTSSRVLVVGMGIRLSGDLLRSRLLFGPEFPERPRMPKFQARRPSHAPSDFPSPRGGGLNSCWFHNSFPLKMGAYNPLASLRCLYRASLGAQGCNWRLEGICRIMVRPKIYSALSQETPTRHRKPHDSCLSKRL